MIVASQEIPELLVEILAKNGSTKFKEKAIGPKQIANWLPIDLFD